MIKIIKKLSNTNFQVIKTKISIGKKTKISSILYIMLAIMYVKHYSLQF